MSKRIISLTLALFVSALSPGTDAGRACAQVFSAGAKAGGPRASGNAAGAAAGSLFAPALPIPGGLAPLSRDASLGVSPPPNVSPIRSFPSPRDPHPAMVLSAGVVLSAASIRTYLAPSAAEADRAIRRGSAASTLRWKAADFERGAALDAARFDGSQARPIAPPDAIGALHGGAALDPARLAALPVDWSAGPYGVQVRRFLPQLATAEGRTAAAARAAADPHQLSALLVAMFEGLDRVMTGGLPAERRHEESIALARAFAGTLEDVRAQPAATGAVRRQAGRALARFFARDTLLQMLARKRELLDVLAPIAPAVKPEGWRLPAPEGWRLPAWEKPERGRVRVVTEVGYDALKARLVQAVSARDRAERRARLGRAAGLSDALVARLDEKARREEGALREEADVVRAGVHQLSTRLRNVFAFPEHNKAGRPEPVGVRRDLSLAKDWLGYRLSARLRTDIEHEGALAMIKASIEDYWRGWVWLGWRPVFWRTRVEFIQEPEGAKPPLSALFVTAGRFSAVLGPRMTLEHTNLRYSVPAHEFGHLLGFPDEYSTRFDRKRRVVVMATFPDSLMGSSSGRVLRRHWRALVDAYDRVRVPNAPKPTEPYGEEVPPPHAVGSRPAALGASAYSGLALMALAFLIYPLYPFIAALPLPLAGKVAVGAGAYALSWGLFFTGVFLGGIESWRYLKARLRRAPPPGRSQ